MNKLHFCGKDTSITIYKTMGQKLSLHNKWS